MLLLCKQKVTKNCRSGIVLFRFFAKYVPIMLLCCLIHYSLFLLYKKKLDNKSLKLGEIHAQIRF